MAWDSELEAFDAYARALPNNCTFVVDTYDSLEGARHAVEVGLRLRERGHELVGVRIDSGDLAWLSKRVREILDEGGFPNARIVASNELDEHLISSLKEQGARIDVWGVGTKMATAWDQPALGGVYKLAAVREPGAAEWTPRVKLSEQVAKVTTPGVLGVRRYRREDGSLAGDMIYDVTRPPAADAVMIDPDDPTRRKAFAGGARFEELLVPVVRAGTVVYDPPPLALVRDHAAASLGEFDSSITRFLNPHSYPVGLEKSVHDLRTSLVYAHRGLPVPKEG
jgi:nicotinate phosphoribosyltransferase